MNQYELNKQIEKLVLSKNEFTAEELELIAQYTGMGGLEKQGASGKGLLHEYYTPSELIQKMWALATKYGFSGGKVLEPSAGIGRVLLYDSNPVLAYEINPITAKICKILNPHARVENASFSHHFYENGQPKEFENDFDLVIGNPPFGEWNDINVYAEKKHLKLPKLRMDQYFILRSLDCLKPGGLLVFVVTDNLFSGSYPEIVAAIEKKSELIDAYLLPQSTFTTTKIQTSLIVLKKY